MKKRTLYFVAIGFILSSMLASCSKDDVKTKNEITDDMTSGTWKITYFNDSGDDETSNFTAYTFEFNENGDLKANSSSNNYTGSWSVTDSNSDDDSSDDLHFNIQFNLSNEFEDLNDDWDILEHTESKLRLEDVSGGNGGTDLLTFEKI